jgi:tetratricopeptide (TPR) repeat protein
LLTGILGGAQAAAGAPAITFNQHIAPIVLAHCASCHRPGGGAPFSLLTYADVRQRGALIERATRTRYMPPWKPEPGYGEFAGVRRLSDADVDLIAAWIKAGMPEGELRELPPVPRAAEWQLGSPDLVVTMPEPYVLAPDGGDVFRTFVVPIPVPRGRFVRAVAFQSNATGAVHHAAIKIDPTRSSRMLDDADAGPGYDGGGAGTAVFPDGHFLAWTPGQSASVLPDDMAWRLAPASDLVLELHLMPTGKPERVQASVGLYFTDRAPTRRPFIVRLGKQDIDIPPGDRHYVLTDSFKLPVDVDVLAVQPHAHFLAREVRGLARLPDGTTKWLVFIKDWDFRWQDVYRMREPLPLPKGTTLEMRYTYDNSDGNVRNPHRPPARVTYGQTTASEMGNLWIQLVPHSAEDLAALEKAHAPKVLAGDIAGYRKMLEVTPGDARLHSGLGFLYVDAGRLDDAVSELAAAARAMPESPTAHYALGTVLLRKGRLRDAEREFLEALRLKADFAEAHRNLGVVFHAQGRLEEAVTSYAAAVRFDPDSAAAHYNLGRAYAAQGNVPAAIGEYRRALTLQPEEVDTLTSLASALASSGQIDEALVDYRRALELAPDTPAALLDLAFILATSSRSDVRAPGEAVRLAERLTVLTRRQNAAVLDTLATTYASAGRGADAVRAAEEALGLAESSSPRDEHLISAIRAHLSEVKQTAAGK